MSIVVISPIKLVSESLIFLLASYGFEACADMKDKSDLILVDLIHAKTPYPKPYPVPTIALTNSDPSKSKILLELGYVACIDATQTSETLIHTIKLTLANQTLLVNKS
jgi:hypothetical protein